MTATHYPFTIARLSRNDAGIWTADLNIYGETVAVDRRFGSWRITPEVEGREQSLALKYAVALQERVRKIERAEARSNA